MFRSSRRWSSTTDFDDNSFDFDNSDDDDPDSIPEETTLPRTVDAKSPISSDAQELSRGFDDELRSNQQQSYNAHNGGSNITNDTMTNMTASANATATKVKNDVVATATKVKNDAQNAQKQATDTARQIQKGKLHVDPAERIYETAKGVWAFGKRVFLVGAFMGIAESITGKTLSIAGMSLGKVDGAVTSNLHGIDDKLFNPAIRMVVDTFMNACGKTEQIFKPVIHKILNIKEEIEGGEDPVEAIKKGAASLMKEGEKNAEQLKKEGEKIAPEVTTKGGNPIS